MIKKEDKKKKQKSYKRKVEIRDKMKEKVFGGNFFHQKVTCIQGGPCFMIVNSYRYRI